MRRARKSSHEAAVEDHVSDETKQEGYHEDTHRREDARGCEEAIHLRHDCGREEDRMERTFISPARQSAGRYSAS